MLSTLYQKQIQWIKLRCTSKGNNAGHGGSMKSFFVAVSFGKGICYCKHYQKRSGKLFAEFIGNNFTEMKPHMEVFVQDSDQSQKSKAAKTALDKIGAVQFSIPPLQSGS